MKNVFVHFPNGENVGFKFAEIPRIGELIVQLLADDNSEYLVVKVVHLAIPDDSGFDLNHPSNFVGEVWLEKN